MIVCGSIGARPPCRYSALPKCTCCRREISISQIYRPGDVRTALCPNIIGGVSTDGEYGADIFKISSINGAFVSGATVMGWSTTATQKGVTTNTSWLRLNASKSNGIYSKSNTVQSAALQILIIIKIWSALFLNSVPLNNAFTADASNLICIWELLP